MMTKQELQNAWAKWLLARSWDFFVTLTFYDDITPLAGKRRVNRWLREIDRAQGGDFCWIRVGEIGPIGGRYHAHLLLGGTNAFDLQWWDRRWNAIGGRARIEHFDQQRSEKGVRYLLKDLHPGAEYDLDLHLPQENSLPHSSSRHSPLPLGEEAACISPTAAVNVATENGLLIIEIPLQAIRPSKSGKRSLVASTHGVLPTAIQVGGHCVAINVNAFINPKTDLLHERIAAYFARISGRLR